VDNAQRGADSEAGVCIQRGDVPRNEEAAGNEKLFHFMKLNELVGDVFVPGLEIPRWG